MYNLFILTNYFNNGFYIEIFNIIYWISIILGILVVINKNPIISVLYLIGLYLNISAHLFLLGINFIGFSYLLVYVGAISILFLFILMLINIRISELVNNNKNSMLLALFISIISYYIYYNIIYNNSLNDKIEKVNYVTSNVWDGELQETIDIVTISNILYTNYSLWLMLTSIILILAMIGTIAITTTKKITRN